MKKNSSTNPVEQEALNRRGHRGFYRFARLLPFALIFLALAGCQSPTTQSKNAAAAAAVPSGPITLREGDVLRVTFPGAPNLDTQPQPIRRDGYITLPLIGEVKAAGMTPNELEKDLVKRYSDQLVSKEVSVTVVSSAYVVYVTGYVLRPGKIASDHPMSALEAIMEAGGFDYSKANLKAVTVIRHEGDRTKNYTLNLKSALNGGNNEPFYLKPFDIVYVPERFSWF